MSHAYQTYTFTANPHDLPSSFTSKEHYDEFSRKVGNVAHDRSDALHHVWGSTRGGWAIYTLKNLLASERFPSLLFLTDTGHQYNFEDEHGCVTKIAIIDAAHQASVISDIENLIAALVENPSPAYDAEEFGIYGDGDVEAALQHHYVCSSPSLDRQVDGDEGQSADYLFVFLRSILEVMKNAKCEELSVVHELNY